MRSVSRNACRSQLEALSYGFDADRVTAEFFEVSGFLAYLVVVTLFVGLDDHPCACRDHVISLAPAKASEFQPARGRLGEFLCDIKHEDTFLSVDDRKISIRSKSEIRHFFVFKIIAHAVPVRLLIKAEDQADPLIRLHAEVFQRLHRVKRRDRRSFVVIRAAAIDLSVGFFAAERIVVPAFALGNAVEMSRNAHYLFALAKLEMAAKVIHVHRIKTQLSALVEHIMEGIVYSLAKRRIAVSSCHSHVCAVLVARGSLSNALDRDEFL